ncbi:hypothetical protein ABIB27_003175 [Arthrobacter sp. UYEF21]
MATAIALTENELAACGQFFVAANTALLLE